MRHRIGIGIASSTTQQTTTTCVAIFYCLRSGTISEVVVRRALGGLRVIFSVNNNNCSKSNDNP